MSTPPGRLDLHPFGGSGEGPKGANAPVALILEPPGPPLPSERRLESSAESPTLISELWILNRDTRISIASCKNILWQSMIRWLNAMKNIKCTFTRFSNDYFLKKNELVVLLLYYYCIISVNAFWLTICFVGLN